MFLSTIGKLQNEKRIIKILIPDVTTLINNNWSNLYFTKRTWMYHKSYNFEQIKYTNRVIYKKFKPKKVENLSWKTVKHRDQNT